MVDAVVIGAGHNGLVAANLLADEGWDVVVLEAQPEPGGAVRSGELTVPGFTHDLFSAFYPLAVASPVLRRLELDRHGLRWRRAPLVLAHPTDGGCPVLSTDLEETCASLDRFAHGDGDAWRELYGTWRSLEAPLLAALLGPFPPVLAAARLAGRLGRDVARFARFALLPARTLAAERFGGEGGALLLAGNALHADLAPESTLSGLFGWLLASLGQQHGFPVPEGGARGIVDALVARLRSAGGTVRCGTPVARVTLERGRVVGVRTASGENIPAARAVIADIAAPVLYLDLVGKEHLPDRLLRDLGRFQWDHATFKVDWALREPIPWRHEDAHRAGTVHLSRSFDHLTIGSAQLAMGRIPAQPYLVMGQLSNADPTRSPPGTETAWAYTHVPARIRGDEGGDVTGRWDEREEEALAERIEEEIERQAPGFRDVIIGRHVLAPPAFEERNASLVGGALNGGSAQLHQQLVFRPTPGLGRPETHFGGLYLASSSAHPGGGVHGAPGANAAGAAVSWARLRRRMVAVGAGAATTWLARRAVRSPGRRRCRGAAFEPPSS